MKKVLSTLLYILGAMVAAYLITHFVGMRAVVDGVSMEPTLSDKDNLIVEKVSYYLHDPARFDIVICPGIPGEGDEKRRPFYIKRIIGLPGETIGIENGKVTINGRVLEEDVYGKDDVIEQDPTRKDMLMDGPYQLKEDEYFLMGDNRNNSTDSRDPMLGPVKKDNLIGKVWVRIWPLSSFGKMR